MRENKVNAVFYAKSYHPIQAGSIDGTDLLPHDNAVYRAFLCYSASLYDPFGDPKAIGDPYCTVFVGRLSHSTTEHTLRKAMSKYGKVKNLRLVRDIVTGASRGYAFVEFETEREMRRAYMDAHHSFIDDSEIIVDYNRQQLMPGWIPRRWRPWWKEGVWTASLWWTRTTISGSSRGPNLMPSNDSMLLSCARFHCHSEANQSIPVDELKRLGISPPPEGRYMSRFQVPSPPRRNRSSIDREPESSYRRHSIDKDHRHGRSSEVREELYNTRSSRGKEDRARSSSLEEEHFRRREKEDRRNRSSMDKERESSYKHSMNKEHRHRRSSEEREECYSSRSSRGKEECRSSSSLEEEHFSRREKEKRSHRSTSVEREKRFSKRSSWSRGEHSSKWQSEDKVSSIDRSEIVPKYLPDRVDDWHARTSSDREERNGKRNRVDREETLEKLSDEEYSCMHSRDRKEGSHKGHGHDNRSDRHKKRRSGDY